MLFKTHPAYPFIPEVKAMQYGGIITALNNKKVNRAVTFPHLSNYRMERELIKSNPAIEIYSFEKDTDLYYQIKKDFHKPRQVKLINADAEKYIESSPLIFDMIFFDYCGAAHTDINDLVRSHLSLNGIFALTEFFGRAVLKNELNEDLFEKVFGTKYNLMQFRIFRQVNEPTTIKVKKRLILSDEREKITADNNPIRNSQWNEQLAEEKARKRKADEKRLQTEEKERKLQERLDNFQQRGRTFVKYIDQLPVTEQNICQLYFIEGKSQKEIAKLHGSTQGAISSRISRMAKRVSFLKDFTKIDETITDEDVEYLKKFFDDIVVDIVMIMARTTCQSTTSTIINQKYKLKGGKSMTQVKIRHRWNRALEKIKKAMKIKGCEKLSKFYDFMKLIDNNLYMLHEVKLPQFNRGLSDEYLHMAA